MRKNVAQLADAPRFIRCHECNRGGNGADPDKCSCGRQVTRPGPRGCHMGEPLTDCLENACN